MAIEHDIDSPLAIAVRKAGSQSAFGRLVGRNQSTINGWLRTGKVHHDAVLEVEAVTGISRHDLRPDLYPREAVQTRPGTGDIEIAR